jgi:hypothetical protein
MTRWGVGTCKGVCLGYMRTTIELPDKVLERATVCAARDGISLQQFFLEALEQKLSPRSRKIRREPPVMGSKTGRPIRDITSKQIDDVMFR